MAAVGALNCRIASVKTDLDKRVDEVETGTDKGIGLLWQATRDCTKADNERAIENERRFTPKDEFKDFKEHIDKRFNELCSLITSKGGTPHA